jgi:protein-tyrosine phosphatase
MPLLSGLVEVHSHLIPAVDDGSRNVEESVAIARAMVEHGYEHLVCTPHIWDDLPHNNAPEILRRVTSLQADLTAAGVGLKLYPGGEVNLTPSIRSMDPALIPTYGGLGKHVLCDAWIWEWEPWLTQVIRHLQMGGERTLILAHPERLGLIQNDPSAIDRFADLGLLFQGNMYCLVDPEGEITREIAELMLERKQYYMLGGDVHRLDSLPKRFKGLQRAVDLLGTQDAGRLLRENPLKLLA